MCVCVCVCVKVDEHMYGERNSLGGYIHNTCTCLCIAVMYLYHFEYCGGRKLELHNSHTDAG